MGQFISKWLEQSHRRKQIVLAFHQPLTVMQLCRRVGMRQSYCSTLLAGLLEGDIVECLTPSARSSRVYDLTLRGEAWRRRLERKAGVSARPREFPDVPWSLYGFVCHRHRSVIVKSLTTAMQPAHIKRRARYLYTGIRMSANNVRDIIRLFKVKGIVEPVVVTKKAHIHYQLTDLGQRLRTLLMNAEAIA